jgi:NTE family protein
VSEAAYDAWRRARQGRRRTTLPAPAFVDLEGFGASDMKQLDALLSRHVGVPLDVSAVDADIVVVSSLDRYETVTWRIAQDPARGYGLRVRGRAKPYAPPFLMLGVNLENTTSSDFRVTTTARYLTFDVVGSGSEVRLDGTIGSNPSAAIELYRPIGSSPLFVAPYAGVGTVTFDVISEDAVLARYGQTRTRVGLNLGANLGTRSDVRVGAYAGRTSASIEFGDPGLPELAGKETGAEMIWRVDTQDSPVVPAGGTHSRVRLSHTFDSPDLVFQEQTFNSASLTQLAGAANRFWTVKERQRLFVYGGFGTSFDSDPLPTSEFELGTPFRLGAYSTGEIRGSHYYAVSGGYLHQVARLPDFLGGPVFTGAWLENADAFDEWSLARWRTNGGAGVVMDTIVGPVVIAGSWGFDGRWRTYLGIGRIFR